MAENYIESSWTKPDSTFEIPLRPSTLNEFIGQESLKERLRIFINAAKMRGEPLSHLIFCGPPGLGKTTLAHIIAKTMGTNLTLTSGPLIEKPGDLAGILTNLKEGDIFFIDEIHRLPRAVEEYLYPAMEDFKLDILIDSGPSARSVQVKLNRFTMIGATTRIGLLTAPMRSRFTFNARLDFYATNDLAQILTRSATILKLDLKNEAATIVAERSRGTPRIANNLLKWVRDFSQSSKIKKIDEICAFKALEMLAIDNLGLDEMDKKILSTIIDHYSGGPVGIETIGIAIGEEPQTLSEVYEPYLIKLGLIKRTPRGRVATPMAYKHLNRKVIEINGEKR